MVMCFNVSKQLSIGGRLPLGVREPRPRRRRPYPDMADCDLRMMQREEGSAQCMCCSHHGGANQMLFRAPASDKSKRAAKAQLARFTHEPPPLPFPFFAGETRLITDAPRHTAGLIL